MNEDSGGVRDDAEGHAITRGSSSWQMTSAEEAALLAEYGVEPLYDDDVGWVEPSHFKSQLGDGHVFLTGAATEDEVLDDNGAADCSHDDDGHRSGPGRHMKYRDPLRLYLHQNVPSLMTVSRSAPLSLIEAITDLVDTLESRGDVDGSKGVTEHHVLEQSSDGFASSNTFAHHSAVLRSGKEWIRRARLTVEGASTTVMASMLLVPDTHETSATPLDNSSRTDPTPAAEQAADVEYRRVIESTQELLAAATEVLCPRSAKDVSGNAEEIAQAVRELEDRAALLFDDALDAYYDDDEKHNEKKGETELLELIRESRTSCARLHAVLRQSPDDAQALNVDRNDEQVEPVLPTLYAFDMELSHSVPVVVQSLPISEDAVLRAHEEYPETPSAAPTDSLTQDAALASFTEEQKFLSISELMGKNTEVLTLIANADAYEAETEVALEASRDAYMPENPPTTNTGNAAAQGKSKISKRNALGLATLHTFVEQLDVLLSPIQEEYEHRDAIDHSPKGHRDTELNDGDVTWTSQHLQRKATKCSEPTTSAVSSSLERIRRQAAIESFLVGREAAERHQMRIEDELVERELRAVADRVAWYADQLTSVEEAAFHAFKTLCVSELAAYEELVGAASRDRALAQQSQELRRLQETEKLAYTLLVEWEVQREQLTQDEAFARRLLHRDSSEEEHRARVATQLRLDNEFMAAKNAVERLRSIFEQHRVLTASCASQSETGTPEADTATSAAEHALRESQWFCWRIAPLLKEHTALMRWALAQRRELENLRTLLVDAERRYRNHLKAVPCSRSSPGSSFSAVVLPDNPPLTKEDAVGGDSAAAGTAMLNADTLVRLLWSTLHAAMRTPRRAPQYLAKLILSLEDLTQVDWVGLRHLRLSTAPGLAAHHETQTPFEVSVASLVKELDVSGNAFRIFDLIGALHTFSSMQSLSVSNAELNTLEASGVAETENKVSAVESPDKSRASSRRISSSHSLHLRHVTAARNNALAERVHLLTIDVSSNHLGSLTPLGTITSSSLVCCIATENNLSTLDSLIGCVQLRQLSVAHNSLTSAKAVCTMPLLRELDVGSNKLESLMGEPEDNRDDASAPSLVLLSRLYASRNPLRVLRLQKHVYPCLTHLFVNYTELTTLEASSLGWLPMLMVLQAEGNQIADISGLQHCPRLQTLKLSHNRIATLSSLEPLRYCTRLRVLDLSGNPCLRGNPKETQDNFTMRRLLGELVPCLEELNNIRLESGAGNRHGSAFHAALGDGDSTLDTVAGSSMNPESHNDLSFTALAKTLSPCFSTSPQLYQEVFSALCWDAQMQRILEDKEIREAYAQRPVNRAKGWEITAVAAAADAARANDVHRMEPGHDPVAVAELSGVTAAQSYVRTAVHQRHVDLCRVDGATVSEWISLSDGLRPKKLARPAGHDLPGNMHVRHVHYEQRQQDHLERLARAFIEEWLHARILVRRARRELSRLRVAYQHSEASRREVAARRIQPLWRGAALRSRLKRFLHPEQVGKSEEDVDEYHKVNVDEWLMQSDAALVPVEVLLHDVVDSARGVGAVPFDLPTDATVPTLTAITGVPASQPSTTFTPVPPSGERESSGTIRSRLGAHTNTEANSTADGAEPLNPKTTVTTLDDQWGPAVAEQLRKRQQKSTRAHQERMRKEFLQDPLRIKREVREGRTQQRPK